MVSFSKRIAAMKESADVVKNLFGNMSDPEIISFGGGASAVECLPIDAVREIVDDVLRHDRRGEEALQYGKIQGVVDLREQIIKVFLEGNGIVASVDDLMVINGGLEGLYLLAQAVIDPGDVILVENPTFVQALEIFQMAGARCVGCDTDDDGIMVDDVEKKIQKYQPKIVYVIPTFQNPSGKTLSEPRRKKLAELAAVYDVLILEDMPYAEIRYSGEKLLPVKAFDKSGNVVYVNSFSKNFSAGMRLGYILASAEIMSQLINIKTATNSHTGNLQQIIVSEFLKRGLYLAHIKRLCDIMRERRDTMLACIEEYFPKDVKYTKPDGGVFVWVELPGDIDTSELLKIAQTKYKVAFIAGDGFFVEKGRGKNCMRLSYGKIPPTIIREGMKRLGDLIMANIR